MKHFAFIAAIAILCAGAGAQVITLPTTFAGGNGQSGNMFDIVATNAVDICQFDISLAGTTTIEVWTLTALGGYLGNEAIMGNWTLNTTAVGVIGNGIGVPTPVPLATPVPIAAGTTQAFYVTSSTGGILDYTNGTTAGAVFASDANISFLEGIGNAYPFGAVFTPRIFNGNIIYTLSGGSCATLPYQTNSGDASLDIDNVMSGGLAPAITTICVGQNASVNTSSSNVGLGWDLALDVGTLIPAPPGFLTGGGQAVNVNLASPSLFFLNGGAVLTLTTPYPGAFTLPVASPAPVVASAQAIHIAPGNPESFALSQGSQLDVTTGSTLTLLLGDDATQQVFFAAAPLCFGGTVAFYGAGYSDFFVNSNGEVSFTAGSTDFTATIGEWQTMMPRTGFAADFEPNNFGTIAVTAGGGADLTVNYLNMAEWGLGGAAGNLSYSIAFNGGLGLVEINNFTDNSGLWGVTPSVMGITMGAGGTNPPAITSWAALQGMPAGGTGTNTDSALEANAAGLINTPGVGTPMSVVFPTADGGTYAVN
ncbi:MAG: hypothetical protein CMJ83_03565 [Planctomycetes bacterium]|nr:hypothetical protein [Planctomycetota bacterium]